MKKIFTLTLVALSVITHAQVSPEQQSMLDAEWAFIKMAKEKSTHEAFVAQFTDETVLFDNGPVNAKKLYEGRKPGPGWLDWQPCFSDIAASNDFGYNTGPWKFHRDQNSDAIAYGYFVSVWKKHADGTWKLAFDGGISTPKPESLPALKVSTIKTKKKKESKGTFNDMLLELEKNFIAALSNNRESTYQQYLSQEARVYRNNLFPAANGDESMNLIRQDNQNRYVYNVTAVDVASSGDFGFAYGSVVITKPDNTQVTVGYARIWKREDGKNWKLILDLVSSN
jgi:ketosteroid isomerase-like protein